MIDIKFISDDKTFDLFVKGHADFAQKGQDIVCAAVSILVQTLADCLDEMSSYYDIGRDDDGVITHIGAAGKNAAILGETTLHGLQLVANAYPDFVKLTHE